MVMQQVQVLKEVSALLRGKETPVILDLEESLRAKGDMTQGEEVKIYARPKIGEPPIPRFPRIGVSTGIAWFGGKFVYYTALRAGAEFILKRGEERMKMELANIILNKHSDEKTLVEAVKENFFAEHLFSDQYQDRQLFRWHLRNTYVDSAFMERVKEIEVKNSDDGSGSISGHRTTNTRSFGDLMEDPLACILGSSDSNIQSNKSAEHTGTTVKRREVRAHRRSHRHHHHHHHRHADKFSAL
ncbi:hypothetical protein OsI_33704 [Oryza sativa Indica Group]|uniref:Uncharacterized protein n=1 Tax=Oryza sativa subsp. indica TaxID=39946 RepID=B8BGZ6_ORYSI|nr:hypothetical protein OsI_33704 [Oryza sativa Indica Group]